MDPYIYVIVHTPDGDLAARYCGMGIQVISDMLSEQGLTGTIVSKEDHDAFVAAHQP